MNDQSDFAKLARQYLDLWEGQLTAISADPDLAEQSARFFGAMTQLGKDMNPLLNANFVDFLDRAQMGTRNASDPTPPATDRTAPAPATSGDRDEWMDQLSRRLAALEERLNKLEARGSRESGGNKSRARAKSPVRKSEGP